MISSKKPHSRRLCNRFSRRKRDRTPFMPAQSLSDTFREVGRFETGARITRTLAINRGAAWRDACGDHIQQATLAYVVNVVEEIEYRHMPMKLDWSPRVLMNETQVLEISMGNLLHHRDSSGIPIDASHLWLNPAISELCPGRGRWDDERRYGSLGARKYFR